MKIEQVNDHVHIVAGTNVNWAIVTDPGGGREVTLVDAGYRRDAAAVRKSLAAIGRSLDDVQAIALTHAHLDHMGSLPVLRKDRDIPVYTGTEEARHARREYLEQITPRDMLAQCRVAHGRKWVAQTLHAATPGLSMKLPDVVAAPDGIPLDAPGGLIPVPTPGHTTGHVAFLMPSTGTVFTGDALVTGHPLSWFGGPQLLSDVFNTDEAVMVKGLENLRSLPADTVVPGHGPCVRGELEDLVSTAVGSMSQRALRG